MKRYCGVPVGILAILAGALLALCNLAAAAGTAPPDLGRCASIADSLRRLDCYDKVAKRSPSKNDKRRAEEEHAQAEAARKQAESEKLAKEEEEKRKAEDQARKAAQDEIKAVEATARSAIDAVRKLQTRVQVGVSYRDYPPLVSDAKYEIARFSDSAASKKIPDVDKALNAALKHYVTALEVWSVKFSRRGARDTFARFENPPLFDQITLDYEGMSRLNVDTGIIISGAISVIWVYASTSLSEAELALKIFLAQK